MSHTICLSPELGPISEERGRKARRSNMDRIPHALQDSPYLKSPIRPKPTFGRSRSRGSISASVRRVKRSIGRTFCGASVNDNRAASPGQSTIASSSLRLSSPYSESLFSSQMNSVSERRRSSNGKQSSLNRAVLLPYEVDDLVKTLKVEEESKKHNDQDDEPRIGQEKDGNDDDDYCNESFDKSGGKEEDEYYDSSDLSDDGETITSDCAESLNDEIVYSKIEENEDKSPGMKAHPKHEDQNISQFDQMASVNQANSPTGIEMKLPAVGLSMGDDKIGNPYASKKKRLKKRRKKPQKGKVMV